MLCAVVGGTAVFAAVAEARPHSLPAAPASAEDPLGRPAPRPALGAAAVSATEAPSAEPSVSPSVTPSPELPAAPEVPALPGASASPEIPSLPDASASPGVPALPDAATPEVPAAPGVPAPPGEAAPAPEVPDLAATSSMAPVPSVPVPPLAGKTATPRATAREHPKPSASGGAPRWRVLFSDDFSGPKGAGPGPGWVPDLGHRTRSPLGGLGPERFGTGEIAAMTADPANVATDGKGRLALTPRRKGTAWTSARINSARVFKFADGTRTAVEASIRMPDVSGVRAGGYWPAFWLLNQAQRLHPDKGNWPSGGEIDVVENVNGENTAYFTLHCGIRGEGSSGGPCREPVGRGGSAECAPISCSAGFHTYRIEFDRRTDAEEIRWYLDGQRVHRVARDEPPRDVPGRRWRKAWDAMTSGDGFFLIFNVAMGGAMPRGHGATVGPATEPGRPMLVDKVAVSVEVPAAHPSGHGKPPKPGRVDVHHAVPPFQTPVN
ncbi:family 16 glycosylhydrolase [Actinocorallia sp. A-T 12471]|uniref:family 16 glycosylhydrolase n=1 Tax=Actinocorallia sp. A-T 12471 TaxID=3089813 RepID=UPI0029D36D6C|nr:family 16 glycosylhydrolase [Actinocorallia sp. A-T 12471]MDX6739795.1 family 16 glycosylhydrolase [Actinocorallia sp. A-T 12471]